MDVLTLMQLEEINSLVKEKKITYEQELLLAIACLIEEMKRKGINIDYESIKMEVLNAKNTI